MLHTQLVALALVALATAASGCGSSKTGSTTTAASTSPAPTTTVAVATGAPLSRARFIAAGDAICENVQLKLNALHGQLLSSIPQAAVYYAAEAESMGKIVPPKSLANDWQQIIDDVHVYGEYASNAIQNAKEHHGTLSTAFRAKVAGIQANMIATAKRDGFKWCSVGE
jgi:hypothetical protein